MPPIIIEFQQSVNEKLMNERLDTVFRQKKDSKSIQLFWLYVLALPCDYWTDRSYIVDESSIKNHTVSDPGLDSNLDPFTTYCLFLTSQATSIDLAPMKENTPMKTLYTISQIANAKLLDKDASVIEELSEFNDICCKQYEKVLARLTDDSLPRSAIKEYALQSLQYSIQHSCHL